MAFGRLADGRAVERITLRGNGLEVQVLTFGALIQDLRVQGRPVVLGFDTFEPYLAHSPYFGAIAGRCANRIAQGRLHLDDASYELDLNEDDRHHLHGGRVGFSSRLWRLEAADGTGALLSLDSPDGDQGYPGRVRVTCRYELVAGMILRITLEGWTDAPTLLNLAAHSYFNLDGAPDILGHRLYVDATHYLPVDDELIPTGEVRPVADTPFDFREARRIGATGGGGRDLVDHNFCLSVVPAAVPRRVARLEAGDGSLVLGVSTTEPGLQVYDGAKIDVPVAGLEGRRYGAHAGLCLEPQRWPDAINHPGFAGAILRPGETYRQVTEYVFTPASPGL